MSKLGIKLKIAVNKIDKALLFKGQNTYLDCTVFVDPDNEDKYGNHGMITQDVSKESREAGEKGPILGNAKIFFRDNGAPQMKAPPAQQPVDEFDDTDLPF